MKYLAKVNAKYFAAAPVVQGEPVGLSRIIEMIEARASIRKSGMIDGITLLRDLKAILAATPSASKPAEQQVSTHWSHDNPGLADQYRGEAMAARRSVGFKQDADDVSPTDISAAIESLTRTAAPAVQVEPVAWMHSDPGRVDVIHDKVRKLLKDSSDNAGYLHRPLDKSERYTIPLYTAPQPAEQQQQTYDSAAVRLDKRCREAVAAALGFIHGGDYAWSYLLQQIKDITSAAEAQHPAEQQPAPDVTQLVDALESLIKGYVGLLEAGKDRITSLGGDCDPVPVMEKNDPWLRGARAALAAYRKQGANP